MRTSFGKGLIDATIALLEVAIFKVEYEELNSYDDADFSKKVDFVCS